MNKPWEQYGITETEWREYQDEYADWLDELNKITPDDSSVTTAEGMTPSFCTVKGGVQ